MNLENIKDLQNQLSYLGFTSLGTAMVKKICFKPDNLFLMYEILRGNDKLNFSLYIEKELNTYHIKYYDASILKEILFQHTTINGVDTELLENKMILIDWRAFGETDAKMQDIESKEDWENETMIESIIEDLEKLKSVEEGKKIAINLKLKFWNGIKFLEEIGNLRPTRNNSEVSQRFHFHQQQTGITIDEAYRFLKNMFMEKYVQQLKKKIRSDTSKKRNDKPNKSISLKKPKINLTISKETNA